ncbi:hypothetical protein PR202_gb00990 [Eleusine coracana subsp. coracana]|uniref:Uncharacterized protein n=1 Tax=Eleusine coracana subsp. coracana TaxID=191504 RepID=A0AAV5DV64_ELECO|nr:hypothetical protein PR202_gb00990 [Eleusine coracana subsp. coracana]
MPHLVVSVLVIIVTGSEVAFLSSELNHLCDEWGMAVWRAQARITCAVSSQAQENENLNLSSLPESGEIQGVQEQPNTSCMKPCSGTGKFVTGQQQNNPLELITQLALLLGLTCYCVHVG